MISNNNKKNRKTDVLLYVLVIFFSMGSWIDINAIFSQINFISQIAPESSELISFIALLIQVANIFPLLYIIGRNKMPTTFQEKPMIIIILLTGTICLFVTSFIFDKVVMINNKPTSLPLLITSFIISIADTTSSVTFLPFMSLFPQIYFSAYFIGQSLSGLIPSILTFIQGIETYKMDTKDLYQNNNLFCPKKPITDLQIIRQKGKRFTTLVFFLIITFIMLLSLFSFIILSSFKIFYKKMARSYDEYIKERKPDTTKNQVKNAFKVWIDEWKNVDRPFIFNLISLTIASALGNGIFIQLIFPAIKEYGYDLGTYGINISFLSGAITSLFMLWKSFKNYKIVFGYTMLFLAMNIFLFVISILNSKKIILPITLTRWILVNNKKK